MNVDHEYSPPRNTQTLTLSCVTARWWIFKDTPQCSAFLTSVSHPTFVTNRLGETKFHAISQGSSLDYTLLLWMANIPLTSLKSLETFLPALPYINPPFDVQFTGTRTGMDLHTELLTLSSSLLRGHRDYFPWIIKLSTEIGPGE